MDLMRIADRIWPVTRNLMKGHTVVYRATNGLIGHRFPGGPPMLLLDHMGAKSGQKRTTPLVYVEDLPNLVVVASKGGYPRHPSWYHNLLAHPDTTIQVGAQRRSIRARDICVTARAEARRSSVTGPVGNDTPRSMARERASS